MPRPRTTLSPLEHEVMAVVWDRGHATAEAVGQALRRPLKNATVRTLLRRLETKGYLKHRVDGRAFVYEARVRPGEATSGAVRRLVDRFCRGSVSALLMGLVDEGLIDRREIRELEQRLAERKKGEPSRE